MVIVTMIMKFNLTSKNQKEFNMTFFKNMMVSGALLVSVFCSAGDGSGSRRDAKYLRDWVKFKLVETGNDGECMVQDLEQTLKIQQAIATAQNKQYFTDAEISQRYQQAVLDAVIRSTSSQGVNGNNKQKEIRNSTKTGDDNFYDGHVHVQQQQDDAAFAASKAALGKELIDAAHRDNRVKIKELVFNQGVDINYCDPGVGITAMAIALAAGNVDAAIEMLWYGADPTIQDNNGKNATDWCLTKGVQDKFTHAMKEEYVYRTGSSVIKSDTPPLETVENENKFALKKRNEYIQESRRNDVNNHIRILSTVTSGNSSLRDEFEAASIAEQLEKDRQMIKSYQEMYDEVPKDRRREFFTSLVPFNVRPYINQRLLFGETLEANLVDDDAKAARKKQEERGTGRAVFDGSISSTPHTLDPGIGYNYDE